MQGAKPGPSLDTVRGDALRILVSLRERQRQGRSAKLAEVKATLEPDVHLDFDRYFFFLRKFHYVSLDRDAQLALTAEGERAAAGELAERMGAEVAGFFAEQLGALPAPGGGAEDGSLDVSLDGSGPNPASPAQVGVAAPRVRRGHTVLLPSVVPPVGPVASSPSPAPLPPAVHPLPVAAAEPALPAVVAFAAPPPVADADGRYQRLEALGTGPLATVVHARHAALGTPVVLKELKEVLGHFTFVPRAEVLKRLRRELCAQAALARHPGVVAVLDQAVDGPRPHWVLEACRGSVRGALAGGQGVGVQRGLRWFLQLAYALRAAHAAGLTHHNLKPENVLLDAWGNAKLSDFGLTRVLEVEAGSGLPPVFLGTSGVPYLAPELVQREAGRRDAGAPADVYGLGILLYELLTGQLPGRRSPLPSEANREVPAGLDALFDRMTQDRPAQRYPDVDALLQDFYAAFPDGGHLERGALVLSADPAEPAAAPAKG